MQSESSPTWSIPLILRPFKLCAQLGPQGDASFCRFALLHTPDSNKGSESVITIARPV